MINYQDEMQNFTTLIVDMIKKKRLLAPQGGPIILAQVRIRLLCIYTYSSKKN